MKMCIPLLGGVGGGVGVEGWVVPNRKDPPRKADAFCPSQGGDFQESMARKSARTFLIVSCLAGWLGLVACGVSTGPGSNSGPPRVYVTNEASGDVTVIDAGTDRVISTIPVGKRPRGIQVSPNGETVYVALSGSPFAGPNAKTEDLPPADRKADGIGMIDARKNQLTGILPGGSDPEQFVVSRDGTRLYVSNEDASTASVVDLRSGKVVQTIPVGEEPEGVALSPDGKSVFVTSESEQSETVIETETNKVMATFKVGTRPRAAAFLPDGSRAYVTSETGSVVSVVDTSNYRVTDSIKLEGTNVRPMGIVVAPDGKKLYVTTGHGGKVFVIDTATNQLETSFEVGKRPWGIAITPDGKKIYTANGPSDDVSVVDVATQKVVTRIKVGTRPWGVAIVR